MIKDAEHRQTHTHTHIYVFMLKIVVIFLVCMFILDYYFSNNKRIKMLNNEKRKRKLESFKCNNILVCSFVPWAEQSVKVGFDNHHFS